MNPPATCPKCGTRLLAEVADGLCPHCLMGLALKPPPATDDQLDRCPSEEQLRGLAAGSLPESEANPLREHVNGCPACQLRSDALHGAKGAEVGSTVVEPSDAFSPRYKPPDAPTAPVPSHHLPGDSIPGYQILKEIHRGGQGVVYQAVQKSTKRRVAIKVMREGPFAGPGERSRFEREVRILAALQHPHIVSIHDSGEASGNFFFTMDYISGDALDQYVKQHKLSVVDTLRLFAKVCDAVNAAHLRGIIHRDLKPANIRVDTEGEPHILDFGLARVALGGLTADSRPQMMTMTGDFVGSPPWAAPEQAEGLPHLIDVRTDVYALGVILFQVLTGQFPYDVTGNILDVLERVRSAEPVSPSTLRRDIGDEVETIVLKCLAKDRDRRYQSAGELARDICHYLNGEPIEAKRDSTLYVLRKTLRRYRIPVAVAVAFMIILSVSLVLSLSLWYRAEENFRTAEERRREAVEARQLAVAKTQEAEASAQAAKTSAREARRRLYSRQMALAQQALETNSGSLKGLLEECPREYRGWEWYRLASLADQSRMTVATHAGRVNCAEFSPDGRWVASTGRDPSLSMWDAQTGRVLNKIDESLVLPHSVAFSPFGNRIVFCGEESDSVQVWDVDKWRMVCEIPVRACCAAFSSDGSYVAIATNTCDISIHKADSGETVRIFKGHTNWANALAYDKSGRWLASASWDGTVRVWDTETGESLHTFREPGSRFFGVAFSPDGRCVASAGEDKTVRLWDWTTGRELRALRGHTMAINTVAFSPDGSQLCSGSRDGTLRLWDPETGEERSVLRGHRRSVVHVGFSPDGQSIVSAAREPEVKVWDSAPKAAERVLVAAGQVDSFSFSQDSKLMFVTVNDSLNTWDVSTETKLGVFDEQYLPDTYNNNHEYRKRLDTNGALIVEERATGRTIRLQHENHRICEAHFSPDGRNVATFCTCGMLLFWDVATGVLVRSVQADLQTNPTNPPDFAYSNDGKIIATSGRESKVRVWSAERLQEQIPPLEHPGFVSGVAFNPDGSRIATAGSDIRVWDAVNGELLYAFGGTLDHVYLRVIFSPDGRSIAASSNRLPSSARLIKIWEAADPREFEGHNPWSGAPEEQPLSPAPQ